MGATLNQKRYLTTRSLQIITGFNSDRFSPPAERARVRVVQESSRRIAPTIDASYYLLPNNNRGAFS